MSATENEARCASKQAVPLPCIREDRCRRQPAKGALKDRAAWTKRQRHENGRAHRGDGISQEADLARKLASHRAPYTKEDLRRLKAMIKARTRMVDIGKAMGRTAAAVRMKAHKMGITGK